MGEGIIEIRADTFAEPTSLPFLDIIFVHGLGGDRIGTWQTGPENFWPRWLAAEFPGARVFTFGFNSGMLAGILVGDGATLQDIASTLADALLSRERAAPRTLFVCHSLGGLVVKQMIRRCAESADSDHRHLGSSVAAIAFLGTPHSGARAATTVDLLLRRFLSGQSKQLVYGDAALLDLNNSFRSRASAPPITVRSYYETDRTGGIHVVDRVTADPGVLGSEPVAVQSDHTHICKPENRSSPVYLSVCALIRKALAANPSDGGEPCPSRGHPTGSVPGAGTPTTYDVSPDVLRDYEYFTTVAQDDRRDLAQKLTDVGRGYAIRDAKRKKERFNMALRRHIAQPAAVTRYTRLMSEVESRFSRHVSRAIADGACPATIDGIIQDEVVTPCAALDTTVGDPVTASLVDGALYYLAGNCHLAWDNG